MPELVPVPDQGNVGKKADPLYYPKKRVRDIRNGLLSLRETLDLIRQAYDQEDWKTLGYGSWQEYLIAEYGESAFPRLAKASRDALAVELFHDDMSLRAIAAVLGVGKSTVHNVVSAAQVSNSGHVDAAPEITGNDPDGGPEVQAAVKTTPAKTTKGADGKSYPSKKPKSPEQKDAEADMAWWPDKGYAHKTLMKLAGYFDGSATQAALALGKVSTDPIKLKHLLEDLNDVIASAEKFRDAVQAQLEKAKAQTEPDSDSGISMLIASAQEGELAHA